MGKILPKLVFCAGLQSSGSTLVSWCFLQRSDMDGILDADEYVLPAIPLGIELPFIWIKSTINCFRIREMILHYQDEGFEVYPLLVVRDVRNVFNSLIRKPYGANGITAEDPPLRMRLRRFKEDWEYCQQKGWPQIRFENLLADPENTLKKVCHELELPWDSSMLSWPKRLEDIAIPDNGNLTFHKKRGKNLNESIDISLAEVRTECIPSDDLKWIEEEFKDFNRILGYAPHAEYFSQATNGIKRAVPSFEGTKRDRIIRKKSPFWIFFQANKFLSGLYKRWHLACLILMGEQDIRGIQQGPVKKKKEIFKN